MDGGIIPPLLGPQRASRAPAISRLEGEELLKGRHDILGLGEHNILKDRRVWHSGGVLHPHALHRRIEA